MQVILRQLGDCSIRRAAPSDLISVMEINLKTLPEHYSDYFYESLLQEFATLWTARSREGGLAESLQLMQAVAS